MSGRIVVGTSSWADPGLVEEWYPPGLPARDRLGFYAERLAAVEVDATSHVVPGAATVARRVAVTPPGCTFDVEAPPLLSRDATTLDALPKALREHADDGPRGRVRLTPHPVAVELRHRGWVDRERLEATPGRLEEHGPASVCTDGRRGARPG